MNALPIETWVPIPVPVPVPASNFINFVLSHSFFPRLFHCLRLHCFIWDCKWKTFMYRFVADCRLHECKYSVRNIFPPCFVNKRISYLFYFLWPLWPAHCRYKGLLLRFATLNDTHTHTLNLYLFYICMKPGFLPYGNTHTDGLWEEGAGGVEITVTSSVLCTRLQTLGWCGGQNSL